MTVGAPSGDTEIGDVSPVRLNAWRGSAIEGGGGGEEEEEKKVRLVYKSRWSPMRGRGWASCFEGKRICMQCNARGPQIRNEGGSYCGVVWIFVGAIAAFGHVSSFAGAMLNPTTIILFLFFFVFLVASFYIPYPKDRCWQVDRLQAQDQYNLG